jgi:hypothetical protein
MNNPGPCTSHRYVLNIRHYYCFPVKVAKFEAKLESFNPAADSAIVSLCPLFERRDKAKRALCSSPDECFKDECRTDEDDTK